MVSASCRDLQAGQPALAKKSVRSRCFPKAEILQHSLCGTSLIKTDRPHNRYRQLLDALRALQLQGRHAAENRQRTSTTQSATEPMALQSFHRYDSSRGEAMRFQNARPSNRSPRHRRFHLLFLARPPRTERRWQPLTPIFTWADSRAVRAARELRGNLNESRVHSRTGCRLHSSYWPAKLRWLKNDFPRSFRKVAIWVSPADWILHRLFGTTPQPLQWPAEQACSISGAIGGTRMCRTLRFRSKEVAADPIDAARCDSSILARDAGFELRGAFEFGRDHNDRRRRCQQSRVRRISKGRCRDQRRDQRGCSRHLACETQQDCPRPFRYVLGNKRFVVGGAISNAGNLREWALRELRLAKTHAQKPKLSRTAAAHDSLVVLPFWVDERAPTWPDDVNGAFTD